MGSKESCNVATKLSKWLLSPPKTESPGTLFQVTAIWSHFEPQKLPNGLPKVLPCGDKATKCDEVNVNKLWLLALGCLITM